ncbi:S-adenosylmethionine:tRNA ribosyltransferase-isomerase [Pseudalkalibacillus berkeleyi]|uniref:S-adenosylmethionine:tRNA ribosyltransferase-isomerase n=1 Tax=Pseudalkalibacillus berkeleyi TaxID=1069813 RepID=A0ABS9H2T7_9BACL|nr:S-adenosylmethionine:tRNA ribosyltransferase-isomerase [Pseudalkalibacillus berkeleyi]MCF6138421.1 S-adenosylmethionine:tRNA ribosyltransferase-isomerase [Pseudalkalibacillus berkeleyi]
MALAAKHPIDFDLPIDLNATGPPETKGLRRDDVKLMILDSKSGDTTHDQFPRLGQYVHPGDLLVMNVSRTLPASFKVKLKRCGKLVAEDVEVRLGQRKSNSVWRVLLIDVNVQQGDEMIFSPNLKAFIRSSKKDQPLTTIWFSLKGNALYNELYKLGEPIRYEYIDEKWGLEQYQTVYGTVPGSVEMVSAGRAFTWELLIRLKKAGVQLANITLHTGLSYYGSDQWQVGPSDSLEEYEVPSDTIEKIRQTKQAGGKIIAIGTTVVRALESAVDSEGISVAKRGWTNLHIDENYSLKVVDGLLTGFHEPKASHLDMLSAFVSPELIRQAYSEAIRTKYLWHEFGDINLIIARDQHERSSFRN